MLLTKVTNEQEKLTLRLEGSIDESTTDNFTDKLSEVISKNFENIYVDLGHVDYISSIGIGALMLAHKKAVKAGKCIIIENMSKKSQEILNMVGILPLFSPTKR